MLSPSLTLVVVRETVTDTSFDTNPTHPTETTSNTGIGHSAYLCRFCNYKQRPETPRLRLRIRRSQVRVLPSAPLNYLHTGDFSYRPDYATLKATQKGRKALQGFRE